MTVPRETQAVLERLLALVFEENGRQNLLSRSTLDNAWERHVEDSLQLVPLLANGLTIDIGSGAGFPGLVIACCVDSPVVLVEPRRQRAEFLARAAESLGRANVTVLQMPVARVASAPAANITARAVAALDALFGMALHCADRDTRWVLPKGRTAHTELEAARASWQGSFELVPSRTDPHAAIVVARNVSRRSRP